MEDDRAGEPVARQDEVPEGVAGIVAVAVGNAEGVFAGCNKEASAAADSNIAAVDTLAGHNTGIEDAKGGRTGQDLAGAGRAVGLGAAAAAAAALAALLAAALAAALAGFGEVEIPGPGRIRRPPR
jgi:hypothetical protein